MRDDPAVVALVDRARDGDQAAWDAIVERYATLVWSVCRRHGLGAADTDDVGAYVWMRLVERLDTIREPAALPGWLAATTRNECLAVLRRQNRQEPVDAAQLFERGAAASDEWLLRQERHIALRQAFAELSERCRELLALLFRDPPMPYDDISSTLGVAIGAIGPSRQRCLERLRQRPAMAALLSSATERG